MRRAPCEVSLGPGGESGSGAEKGKSWTRAVVLCGSQGSSDMRRSSLSSQQGGGLLMAGQQVAPLVMAAALRWSLVRPGALAWLAPVSGFLGKSRCTAAAVHLHLGAPVTSQRSSCFRAGIEGRGWRQCVVVLDSLPRVGRVRRAGARTQAAAACVTGRCCWWDVSARRLGKRVEPPLPACVSLKAADPPPQAAPLPSAAREMDDLSDKGNRSEHSVIRPGRGPCRRCLPALSLQSGAGGEGGLVQD
ncbi:hypothetical protein NDU88_008999 [Pleurodeles waltl]|uniref:Uncharacterized protein n=1 Tax=Pleurodeles waltl TaxID=8319 RepID=A0AAV7QQA3_PLEWA|nr:hypothetical protein NDU88_008999 [Pleurodeles waltl]